MDENSAPVAKKAKLDNKLEEEPEHKDSELTTVAKPCIKKKAIVAECDVGITHYISDHDGFSGIIKQRYSDFIVNEISVNGETIHLLNRDLPKEEVEKVKDNVLTDALSPEVVAKLQKLLVNPDRLATVVLEAENDKTKRTAMHKAVKHLFPALNSNTVEDDGNKMLKISKIKLDKRSRPEWGANRGQYCRFVLYKENKDTMDAVSLISTLARLKTHLFRYAGTKDKRAKTSQEVTAFRVTANKLDAVNEKLRNMMLGNFRYVNEPLSLGQLKGNHFTIILRNVTGTDAQVKEAITSLQTTGFINYYGMQRFGTTSIPTHHVGRALLHSKWEETVDLILKGRDGEDISMLRSREAWDKSRDVSEALRHIPPHHSIEKGLLQALMRQGDRDYAAALQTVTRNTRLMYVHAYQSYVWNMMTSRRIKEFGTDVIKGDLILPKGSTGDTEKVVPMIVTEDNKSEYSMEDVVLPLPGYDIVYPDNEISSWYKELMEVDDLDIDNLRQKHKDYSLSGDYRHLLIVPSGVTWEKFTYNDCTVPLARADLDVMFDKPKPVDIPDGKYTAVKIEMSLPASTYATMALREVLKTETSAAYQTTLNVS